MTLDEQFEFMKSLQKAYDGEMRENIQAVIESLWKLRTYEGKSANADPEPQPGDGPEYHTDHAFWVARNKERRGW